ncbi:MAG: tetratricopeptide repeat protein [Candidatus Thiodiazotropha taylori]|nr:tetratricopeptide repeat protein [Candidatus Thiodiazotropha taylori]
MDNELTLLQDIKSAIWILIYILGLGVGTYVMRSIIVSYKTVKDIIENRFYHIVSAMYENNDYDEVIEYCHDHLSKKPNEAYGYWFLGKAYFQKKKYDESTINFNKAIEINPSWEDEWISPFLKKIELAKSSANQANSADAKNRTAD